MGDGTAKRTEANVERSDTMSLSAASNRTQELFDWCWMVKSILVVGKAKGTVGCPLGEATKELLDGLRSDL